MTDNDSYYMNETNQVFLSLLVCMLISSKRVKRKCQKRWLCKKKKRGKNHYLVIENISYKYRRRIHIIQESPFILWVCGTQWYKYLPMDLHLENVESESRSSCLNNFEYSGIGENFND